MQFLFNTASSSNSVQMSSDPEKDLIGNEIVQNFEVVDEVVEPELKLGTSETRKKQNRKSEVWNHYKRVKGKGGIERAVCNYCQKTDYSCNTANGTTTMWRHLKSMCHKSPLKENCQPEGVGQKTLSFMASGSNVGSNSTLSVWKFDQESARDAYTKMIVVDELPFNFGDGEGFKNFMSIVQPKFKILSRTTHVRDVVKLFATKKKELKKMLSFGQRVCLTSDQWTSRNQVSYMCLTGHFIDSNWKLHKKLLSFVSFPSHKGLEIGKAIELLLLDWGIGKVGCITVDNASPNLTAVEYLKSKLVKKNSLLCGGLHFHVRCCAHILNLIVIDGLAEVDDSIKRIRSAIKYTKSSTARGNQFKGCVEQEGITSKKGLCLDVCTRWNSTFEMLDSALKYQKAFERMEEQVPLFVSDVGTNIPTETDWVKARTLVRILKRFYESTKRLSGSKYVTSNLYFKEVCLVDNLLKEWSKHSDVHLSSMALKMKLKFDKYWGESLKVNELLLVAVVLDPRYKISFVKFCYGKLYMTDKEVKDETAKVLGKLKSIFEEYKISEIASRSENENVDNMQPVGQGRLGIDEDIDDDYFRFDFQKKLKEDDKNAKSEIDKYLDEGCEDDNSSFLLLDWWKVSSNKYPILAAIAKDVFAIPVSTVASESTFSTSGRILSDYRSSLTPKLVECLICTQDWVRGNLKIELPSDLEELRELESLAVAEDKDIMERLAQIF